MKKKNKIISIGFKRDDNQIVITLKKAIPPLGYGSKELRKLLKRWG